MPTRRSYVSPLREQAAARTRAQIIRSATRLFADRGYGRVTVADIAAEAGVSSKAVFASAGSKGDILNEIVDTAVRASGYEQAIRGVLAARDPESALRALAHGTRTGNEGMFDVHEAIHKALPSHEDGEALWERATAEYRTALRAVAHHLRTLEPSGGRADESAEETGEETGEELADLLWFWFGPGGWRTLVVENGWTWDRAEAFLLRTALATLRTPRASQDPDADMDK